MTNEQLIARMFAKMEPRKPKRFSKTWRKTTKPNGTWQKYYCKTLTTPKKKYSIKWVDNDCDDFEGKYFLCGKKFNSIQDAKDYVLLDLLSKPSLETLEYLYGYAEGL